MNINYWTTILFDLTFNNPIFIFVVITMIWFLPGVLVRRISEKKYKLAQAKRQADAIARLYPKDK